MEFCIIGSPHLAYQWVTTQRAFCTCCTVMKMHVGVNKESSLDKHWEKDDDREGKPEALQRAHSVCPLMRMHVREEKTLPLLSSF